jgi:hypothetical protein
MKGISVHRHMTISLNVLQRIANISVINNDQKYFYDCQETINEIDSLYKMVYYSHPWLPAT